jgi:hypothetical protein
VVKISLERPYKNHRISVEITLNMLLVSQKCNDSFRLIVTTRYSYFGSNVMTVYYLTVVISIFDAFMISTPTKEAIRY